MTPHYLTNSDIEKYYPNESTFNGVYSRNNLPDKIKGWDTYNKSWWVFWYWNSLDALHALNNSVTYSDSFWAGQIPKEIKKFIDSQ